MAFFMPAWGRTKWLLMLKGGSEDCLKDNVIGECL